MTKVKQYTKKVNGKTINVKSYERKEPILSAKEYLEKNKINKTSIKIQSYKEFNKEIEKQINKFPIFYAFDKEQLEEGLKKLNTDKDNIISTGAGGFIRKTDKDKYVKMWKDINEKQNNYLKNDNNLYNAFYYEMNNHEYGYTGDITDTLNSLGMDYDKLNDNQKKVLKKAETNYLKKCENF